MIKINICLILFGSLLAGYFRVSCGLPQTSLVSPKDLQTYKQEALKFHNNKREIHGVHLLTLDDKLSKEAQDYADQLASTDGPAVNKNVSYGQIVYFNANANANAESTCNFIYKQSKDYDYSKFQPDNIKQVGLFTQMVSKASCTIGIGMAKSRTGKMFSVFFYYPIGNRKNEYGKNVFPPTDKTKKYSRLESVMRKAVCSDNDRKTYLQENLECHNAVREEFNVAPLVYSDELNKLAMEKVQTIIDKGPSHLVKNTNYNTYWVTVAVPILDGYFYCQHHYSKGKKLTADVLEERERQGKLNGNGGGFSQMIWKSTKEMGYALGKSKTGGLISVAIYSPVGNVKGKFKENINKPKSS